MLTIIPCPTFLLPIAKLAEGAEVVEGAEEVVVARVGGEKSRVKE